MNSLLDKFGYFIATRVDLADGVQRCSCRHIVVEPVGVDDAHIVGWLPVGHPMSQKLGAAASGSDSHIESGCKPKARMVLQGAEHG